MWALVYIVLASSTAEATVLGNYSTINGCFFAREALLLERSGGNEYFPSGEQAICIQTDNK